jgi:simple sugar transport system ATP-binding protein
VSPRLAELRGVSKSYGAVAALQGVSFSCASGEIHALVGENGAGKSTLCGVLAGMVRPDRGEVVLGGSAVPLHDLSPQVARRAGIAMVFQHEHLVPSLRVGENLAFAGAGWLYREEQQARAVRELGERFHLDVDPARNIAEMSAGERQRVELLRALARGARLLILDEPTAVLSPPEVVSLMGVLRHLRAEGCGIVLISHKLDEIRQLADRVTVLRAGSEVGTRTAESLDADEIAHLMLGELPPERARLAAEAKPAGDPVFALEGVAASGATRRSALRDIDLEVRAGEIVGVAGVEGNGQLELEELLAGERPLAAGRVTVAGEPVLPSVRALRSEGVAQLASDRSGLIPGFSIAWNLVGKASYDRGRFFSRFRIRRDAVLRHARQTIEAFGIRPEQPEGDASRLSGGNAQKLVVARELEEAKRALVAFHPTRGLDFGAARFVRERLAAARVAGLGVLLISADLDELELLADRLFVLSSGRLAAVPKAATRETIGRLMLGADPA